MADKWPLANGNWSSAANWNDGTKPVAGDDVYADGKTVTIDEDVTVGSIRNTQRTGGTVGGSFTIGGGRTVTANVGGFVAGSGSSTINTNGNSLTTLNGNLVGSTIAGVAVLYHTGTGPLIVNGNVSAGSVASASGISYASSATITINGNVTGGTAGNTFGFGKSGTETPTVNINGNVTAGTGGGAGTAHGVYSNNGLITINIIGNVLGVSTTAGITWANTAIVSVTGSVTGSASGSGKGINSGGNGSTISVTGDVTGNLGTGIDVQSLTYLTVTGNLYGASTNSIAAIAFNNGSSTITINGNITGGNNSSGYGLWAQGAVAFTINGNVTGGTAGVAINNTSGAPVTINGNAVGGVGANGLTSSGSGEIYAYKAVGNDYGSGSSGLGATVGIYHTGAGKARCKYFQCGSRGMWPVFGPVLLDLQTNSSIETRTYSLQSLFIFTNPANTSGLLPAVTDVRSGVSYNVGNNIGTCAVPSPVNVTSGVAVGNTVGSALLTEQTIRSAMGLSSPNLDTKFNALSSQINTLLSNSPTEAF